MKLIRNAAVLGDNGLEKLDVLLDEGGIIETSGRIEADAEVTDAEGLVMLPGLVDVHVHLRQPGQEYKETIRTGSLAAAHGGFTTILAMPNVNPFPDSKDVMEEYLELIRKESAVHVLPYGTITRGEKGQIVSDYAGMKELGIRWFSDDGVGVADDAVMAEAMKEAVRQGVMFACHTEDMRYRKPGASVHDSPFFAAMGWTGIPSECESEQLERDLELALSLGMKYHGCHISAEKSVRALRKAKAAGGDISAEVTAHHLLLEDRDVRGTNWKMNPPLRTHEDRMALIEALESGVIDFIANDHAPHSEVEKGRPMDTAPFGIVSLETSFPLLYTEFVYRQKRWSLAQLAGWMSAKPARRFGLERLGRVAPGYASDVILVDLEHETRIHAADFLSKGKNTPFDGWAVHAAVRETIAGGVTVWKGE